MVQTTIPLIDNIANILSCTPHDRRLNLWVSGREGSIYIRLSYRAVDGKLIRALDFANIQIKDNWQNKGVFTAIRKKYEPEYNIFIESIMNELFYASLLKDGYTVMQNDTFSLIKLMPEMRNES